MLRFIMRHGSPNHWSGVAISVASVLPQNEAFDILVGALHGTEIGRCSNVSQAIALSKHPGAEPVLRSQLAAIWAHPILWEDADFINWVGFDATTSVAHLIELGAPPAEFDEQVRRLSEHACSHNRKSCRAFLSKYYSWLK